MSLSSTSRPRSYSFVDLPGHARPFGAQLVVDSIRAAGNRVADRFDPERGAGKTLLLSLYWCEDLYSWILYRSRNNIDSRYHVIVGGNQATGSPGSILPFCDGVFLGDADDWDGEDDAHVVSIGSEAKPRRVCEIPQRIIEMEAKSVAKRVIPIMELSRGCKYHCKYCQYSWMKPYREQSAQYIIEQLVKNKGRSFRLASADIPQHKEYGRILSAAQECNVRILNQDGALRTVRKHIESGQSLGKMQRFGVDGMSDAIRRRANKPIKADWLVELMGEYSRQGVTRCLAYNIFGMPGENRDDFLEWDDTVRRIVDSVQQPFTWVNSWNAFLPMPMTPFGREPSAWRRDSRDLKRMAKTREWAKGKGVNVFDMPERTSNMTITKRMLAVRGDADVAHVIRSLALNPKIKEPQVLREYEKCTGRHLHAAFEGALPWEKYSTGATGDCAREVAVG